MYCVITGLSEKMAPVMWNVDLCTVLIDRMLIFSSYKMTELCALQRL